MGPAEHDDNTEDLERRLREAFSAKALQISDADLDHERETEVIAALASQRRKHPATRWFAGIGSAAAAAAIIGVAFVGLHDSGRQQVIDGLPPALTSSSSAATASNGSPATSTPEKSSAASQPNSSATREPAKPDGAKPTQPQSGASTATGPSGSASGQAMPSDQNRTMMSGGSTITTAPSGATDGSAPSMTLAAHQPPAMPGSLPQSGTLSDQEYVGAVPLDDPSGGPKRELSMPSGTKWQRTAETGNSLTVRITDLPTDIEAYWQRTLPDQGWVADGAGWKFPGTGYSVSAITDKGSFTVTW